MSEWHVSELKLTTITEPCKRGLPAGRREGLTEKHFLRAKTTFKDDSGVLIMSNSLNVLKTHAVRSPVKGGKMRY